MARRPGKAWNNGQLHVSMSQPKLRIHSRKGGRRRPAWWERQGPEPKQHCTLDCAGAWLRPMMGDRGAPQAQARIWSCTQYFLCSFFRAVPAECALLPDALGWAAVTRGRVAFDAIFASPSGGRARKRRIRMCWAGRAMAPSGQGAGQRSWAQPRPGAHPACATVPLMTTQSAATTIPTSLLRRTRYVPTGPSSELARRAGHRNRTTPRCVSQQDEHERTTYGAVL